MIAARLRSPGVFVLEQLPEPVPAAGEAVVAIDACGICGSDLHGYRGELSLHAGAILGHEFTGVVLGAPGVAGVAEGDRVVVRPQLGCRQCASCRAGLEHLCEGGGKQIIGFGMPGAFAEQVLVPRAALGDTMFPLPASVDSRAGALTEPLAVGLRAVRQVGRVTDAVVLVVGAGTIGLAATCFLRAAGAGTIVVSDPSALRRSAAIAIGADIAVDPAEQLPSDVVCELTGAGPRGVGARADAAIDCAGVESALQDALISVRPGGTVTLCAVYARPVKVAPDVVVQRELSIRGSFAYQDEFASALEALASGAVDPDLFISHELPLTEIDEAFRLQLDADASLKVMVMPASH